MKLQRMCAVCRELKGKEQLLRIARTSNGFVLDTGGKCEGRGAYICKEPQCIAKAQKVRAFERSFSAKVDESIYDALEAWLENGE